MKPRAIGLFMSAALAISWLLFAACDDGGGTDADSDADIDSDTDVDTDVDGDSDGDVEPGCVTSDAQCTDAACGAGPFAVTCVGGTMLDEDRNPLAGQSAVVCANQRCFAATSDAQGFFAVQLSGAPAPDVAVYFPTNPPRHSPFCFTDALCDGPVHLCTEFVLYAAPTSGTPVPEGELGSEIRITAADGAALVLPAGSEMRLPIGAPMWLALSRFPLEEHTPCFIDAASPPAALYVVTPLDSMVIEPGTVVEPVMVPAGLDLPNTSELPAGTVVDVFVVGGGHALEAGATEGEWRQWTTATVSADGGRIQTSAGEGIGYLTWFGIYPR